MKRICSFSLLTIVLLVLTYSCEKPLDDSMLPELTTTEVSVVTEASAQSGGFISSDAGFEIIDRGVCWATLPNPTIADCITKDAAGTGRFISMISGLTPNTTFYLRAYATNKKGTAYGLQETFTTRSLGLTTVEITDITVNSAKSGGNIAIVGDSSNIIARGVCWNTQANPTIQNFKTTDGEGVGLYSSLLTDLVINTTYYVRSYITNSGGTYYGNEINFTTRNGEISLITKSATSIKENSAISGGNIIDDGGSSITNRGVCWSTSQGPTIADSITSNGTDIGTYTSLVDELIPNTTYYLRAYATNSFGTNYGNEIIFKTEKGVLSLTTSTVTSVTENSAVSGGNITYDGGSEVTDRGVCWSTKQSPTIADNKTSNGSGIGVFTSVFNSLIPNTTYFIRAYATNSFGTYYGNELSFTTRYGDIDLCGDFTTPVVTLLEGFNDVTNNSDVDIQGWKVIFVRGDRNWQGKVYTLGAITETYVQATAHNGTATSYEYWLVTPPLNLDGADSKNFSFSSSKAYWTATSSLKVYVLKCIDGVTTRTEITTANIAKESDTDHAFVPSGSIDLSAYSGTIYIGFQYIALGGPSNSTTFKIDDVMFSVSGTTVELNSSAPVSAKVGEDYSYNITTNVINPNGATTISANGVPSWATFTDNGNGNASIAGTPDAVGSHAISIVATNNSVSDTQDYTLVVTESATSENLLENADFEVWADGIPTTWKPSTTTGVIYTQDKSIVDKGVSAFNINTITSSGTVVWSQIVKIQAGKKYLLMLNYHVVSGDGSDARIWCNFKKGESYFSDAELQGTGLYSLLRGPGNTNSSGSSYFNSNKGAWNKYSTTFTAPDDVTEFDFQFRTYKGAEVVWDNFVFSEVITE